MDLTLFDLLVFGGRLLLVYRLLIGFLTASKNAILSDYLSE